MSKPLDVFCEVPCLTEQSRQLSGIALQKKWFKSAWNYFENMRKNGKGNQIFRFVLVCLAGFIFVPYCAIFTPKYYPIKK